jgi:hypothetical protein
MDITDYKIGCHGSPIDERDVYYSDIVCADSSNVTIPKSFEIKYKFSPKNQGDVNSCVAHVLSEYEEIVKSANEYFSVGFIYGNRKESDYQGSGMVLREALNHLITEGNVLNKDFPINEEYPSIIKTIDTYGKSTLLSKASENKSKGYVQLNTEDIKKYLVTENKPIILAIKVYSNFYELQYNKGIIPSIPNGSYLGGHCMLIVGFNEDKLKILNSWGSLGDNGYVYVDINSSVIKELWALTDERVIKPVIPSNPTTPNTNIPTNDILYRVQLGAFTSRANADLLVEELRNKGIDSCVRLYPSMFKVQCGVYKVKSNSEIMRDKLINLGYKDAFIVEVK